MNRSSITPATFIATPCTPAGRPKRNSDRMMPQSGRGGVRGWEAEGGLPVVKPAPSWMSSPSASQALGS